MKKSISKILCLALIAGLTISVISVENRKVYAGTNQTMYIAPYRVSEEKLSKYKNMTYEELIKIAKPGKEARNNRFDFKNIYYNKFDFDNKVCEQFSVYLYASPEGKDELRLYYFMWDFKDGKLDSAKTWDGGTTGFTSNFKLVDDTEEIKSNKQGISRKIYNNQLEVAKEISKNNKLDAVILSTSSNFADSLSGSTLASKLNAPILFVDRYDDGSTSMFIEDNLKNNGTIYILGGEKAINNELVKNMNLNNKYKIYRISGANRYDTSRLILQKLNFKKDTPVVITNGENYADALSISSIVAIKEYPVLLTTKDNLPSEIEEELRNINPSKVYVLGGNGAISDSVYQKIKDATKVKEENIKRIYGKDRFDTSLSIVKEFNINTDTICFASDKNFEDALSGCLLAKNLNAPIILVGEEALAQKGYVESKKYKNQVFFTSFKGLSNSIINKLSAE